MKKLPVFQTTKNAYNFIFTNIKNIFPMFAQYASSMILLYVFLQLTKENLALSTEGTLSISASFIFFAFMMLTLWLQLPMNISVVRTTAKQEEMGKNYFNLLLTARIRKAFLTMILTSLLSLAILTGIIVLIGGLISIFTFLNLQETISITFSIILTIVGIISVLSIIPRFFLAVPNAALDNAHPIRLSWKISKGHLTRLLAIIIFILLPSIAWSLIVSFLFNINLQTNPLAYGFLSLPQLYLGLAFYAGLGEVYKHLSR